MQQQWDATWLAKGEDVSNHQKVSQKYQSRRKKHKKVPLQRAMMGCVAFQALEVAISPITNQFCMTDW